MSREKRDAIFERCWSLVPRKEGKIDARKHFDAHVRGLSQADDAGSALEAFGQALERAIRNYCGKIEAERIEPQFVMHGSRLFRNFRDYVDWKPVTTPATARRFVA